jgi:hypothetical protein
MKHSLVAAFNPAEGTLVIEGPLHAGSEFEHEYLAALLNEKDVPEVAVEFTNVRDVLNVKISFKHDADIAQIGLANLKLRHEARDRGMSVPELVAEKEAASKAEAAAKKAAKKNGAEAN